MDIPLSELIGLLKLGNIKRFYELYNTIEPILYSRFCQLIRMYKDEYPKMIFLLESLVEPDKYRSSEYQRAIHQFGEGIIEDYMHIIIGKNKYKKGIINVGILRALSGWSDDSCNRAKLFLKQKLREVDAYADPEFIEQFLGKEELIRWAYDYPYLYENLDSPDEEGQFGLISNLNGVARDIIYDPDNAKYSSEIKRIAKRLLGNMEQTRMDYFDF